MGVQLNVDDATAAHSFLRDRGVKVSDVQTLPWGRFCFFSDPDGNGWSVHEPPHPNERVGEHASRSASRTEQRGRL